MGENLEQHRTERVHYVQAGNALFWTMGDLDGELVRRFGRGVINTLAHDEGCAATLVRQRIKVAATFPPPVRYPDVPFYRYRAVYYAAGRTGTDPHQLLEEALAKGWGARELQAIGKHDDQLVTQFKGSCGGCKASWTGVGPSTLQGRMVPCPLGCERMLGVF